MRVTLPFRFLNPHSVSPLVVTSSSLSLVQEGRKQLW